MNIFGEGFPKEIVNQIDVRQKKHGLGYNNERTIDSHLYKNANSSWCRLVSSTDIININKLLNNNLKYLPSILTKEKNKLAKNFVLFNGLSAQNSPNNRTGVGFGVNNAYNSWGINTADFGFRPMAGITSTSIKHRNRGSIRTATVNIKAWDKISFEIIDVLYLRPGFSILLEWGNSMYYDDFENLIKNPNNNDLMEIFLEGNISYPEFLSKIKEKQLKTNGNYDAIFGRVNNIHWSYQPDGSYDISVDITSLGDIVESFKIQGNALSTNINSTSYEKPVLSSEPDYENAFDIEKYLSNSAKINDVTNYLYAKSIDLIKNKNGFFAPDTSFPYVSTDKKVVIMWNKRIAPDCPNGTHTYFIRLGDLLEFIQNNVLYKIKNANGTKESSFLYIDYDEESNLMHAPDQLMSYDPRVCMVRREVYFPSAITEIVKITPEVRTENPDIPVNGYKFDVKSGTLTNVTDEIPDKRRYVPVEFQKDFEKEQSQKAAEDAAAAATKSTPITYTVNIDIDEFFSHPYADLDYKDDKYIYNFMSSKLDEVGKIMNIYINFQFIITKFQELTDVDTNTVNLYDFLKELVSNINSSFGGYSKLDLWIDETSNTLKIIDQNPLPSTEAALNYIKELKTHKIDSELAFFDVTGYYQDEAGFIRDLKFTTEFNSEYSTNLTVSATNQGTAVGENNTALSLLNTGLRDKFKKEINGGGQSLKNKTTNQDIIDNYKNTRTEYTNFLQQLNSFITHLYYNDYIDEEIEDNKSTYTVFLKLYKKYENAKSEYDRLINNLETVSNSNNRFQPGTGFIPFNLSLTMDGLSGMKIGSKFFIDSSYLPSNYPSVMDFLIKSINHEIKDNQWVTTLESFCVAKGNATNKNKTINRGEIKKNPPSPKADETKKETPKTDNITNVPKAFNFHKIPDQKDSKNNNYRSGQFTEEILAYVIKTYGIKNIVRFNGNSSSPTANKKGSDDGTSIGKNKNGVKEWVSIEREAEICESLGCKHYKLSSTKDQDKVNKLLNEGNTLIHCKWGADRTGGNVGGWIYSKTNKTEADTKSIWDYTVQYNSWDDLVSGGTKSQNVFVNDGYLDQAKKFGVRDLDHAKELIK